MTDALPYAAPEHLSGPVSLEVTEDRVVLTVMPVRGLALGLLVFETAACTGLWALWITMVWRFFGIQNIVPVLSWTWEIFGLAIMLIVFPLWWTTEMAIRWIHYWMHGAVPVRLDASDTGILLTRAGLVRAMKRRYWPRADVGRVDMDRTADVLGRRPRVGVRVRNRSDRTLELVQTRGDEAIAARSVTELRRVLGIDTPQRKDLRAEFENGEPK